MEADVVCQRMNVLPDVAYFGSAPKDAQASLQGQRLACDVVGVYGVSFTTTFWFGLPM